jgi:hypothetical protein
MYNAFIATNNEYISVSACIGAIHIFLTALCTTFIASLYENTCNNSNSIMICAVYNFISGLWMLSALCCLFDRFTFTNRISMSVASGIIFHIFILIPFFNTSDCNEFTILICVSLTVFIIEFVTSIIFCGYESYYKEEIKSEKYRIFSENKPLTNIV